MYSGFFTTPIINYFDVLKIKRQLNMKINYFDKKFIYLGLQYTILRETIGDLFILVFIMI